MGLTSGGGGGFVFSKYILHHPQSLNPQVWKYRQIQKANSKIIQIFEEMVPLTNALFKGQMYMYIWKNYM